MYSPSMCQTFSSWQIVETLHFTTGVEEVEIANVIRTNTDAVLVDRFGLGS